MKKHKSEEKEMKVVAHKAASKAVHHHEKKMHHHHAKAEHHLAEAKKHGHHLAKASKGSKRGQMKNA